MILTSLLSYGSMSLVIPDISKISVWRSRWRHCNPSKSLEVCTSRQCVTFRKTSVFSNTAIRIEQRKTGHHLHTIPAVTNGQHFRYQCCLISKKQFCWKVRLVLHVTACTSSQMCRLCNNSTMPLLTLSFNWPLVLKYEIRTNINFSVHKSMGKNKYCCLRAGKVYRNTVGGGNIFYSHIHPYFAGSIPDGVTGILHWLNTWGCTLAMGWLNPNRNEHQWLCRGEGTERPVFRAGNITTAMYRVSRNSGSLNLLEF